MPDRDVTTAADCAAMFADLAASVDARAPFYGRLAAGIAADERLAGLLLLAPPVQRNPVLLLACVHDLLLADRDDGGDDGLHLGPDGDLARHYPDLTADPDTGDPMPAFRRFCDHRADELAASLATRSTQTNEIGRCATLLPAFGLLTAEVGPLAHVDVGASAGLNLLLDHYAYTYEPGGDVGGPSPVHLRCGTRGDVPVPAALPSIVERVGLDRAPVDVHDPVSRRWLAACVWPDQADRLQRLRAALELAAGAGVDVRRGDAVADAAGLAAACSAHPVITNTWVLSYLTADERRRYLASIDELGTTRDVSWVFAEMPALVPELPVVDAAETATVLVLVRWRGGRRSVEQLATSHPHGYWLHWTGR